MHADDAVDAARQALHITGSAVLTAELSAPASILTFEAEAVPAPTQDHLLRPHTAHGDTQ